MDAVPIDEGELIDRHLPGGRKGRREFNRVHERACERRRDNEGLKRKYQSVRREKEREREKW